MDYTSRPDWLDGNFSQSDIRQAVEDQAKAYKNAKKEMQEKENEAVRVKQDLERAKLSQDSYEQRIAEMKEEVENLKNQSVSPDVTQSYGYDQSNSLYLTPEQQKKAQEEQFKVFLEQRETSKRLQEIKKSQSDDIASLKEMLKPT